MQIPCQGNVAFVLLLAILQGMTGEEKHSDKIPSSVHVTLVV